MAFGCKVHYELRPTLFEQPPERRAVTNIDLSKTITPASGGRLRNGLQARSVGEFIDIDDIGTRLVEEMADDSRSNKAGTAGDEDHGF